MHKTGWRFLALVVAAGLIWRPVARAADAGEGLSTIERLRGMLWAGRTTSAQLVSRYEAAIARDDATYRAVIALSPRAGDVARALDIARRPGEPGGALDGIPILLKDNIEADDAPLVARLRTAGAVILGKTNLSEWANFRSTNSLSGWSGVGGQTRNARDPLRNPCGSSSGSAVAVAAGFAAAAIGTETDGSITCPASVNGVVGLKPTVGLVSSARIVPISHTQDTAGPITLTVRDAAILLTAMADAPKADYAARLDPGALRGARIGVMRFTAGFHNGTDAVFEAALARLRAAGATLVEIKDGPDKKALGTAEEKVMLTEFKVGVEAYLATTSPDRVKTRTLADLIAFNKAHAAEEMSLFGQELFETAAKTTGLADPEYLAALATAKRLAGPEGIDRMLAQNGVVALVGPTLGPACLIDPVLKDQFVGGSTGTMAAVAGYPHLTVPMGEVGGLPVGLSFIGPAWSEATLLNLGYAFEQSGR